MLRRRQEELDDLVNAINQECDQPKRFFLRRGELWCNEGNGYNVTPAGLTKNQLYEALRIFLAGVVAGRRCCTPRPMRSDKHTMPFVSLMAGTR